MANRVEEIKKNSLVQDWNHLPGILNPADDVSRGLSPSLLTANHCWLRGLDFLWQPETCWPTEAHGNVPDESLELKKEAHMLSTELSADPIVTRKEEQALEPTEGSVESPTQFLVESCSDWTRLRCRVAWFLCFVQFIQDRKGVQTGRLIIDDYDAATLAI